MRSCEGRVVAITGAGGGLGRAHALKLAAEGAQVVVNDLGSSLGGDGRSVGAANAVVEEIVAAGGQAVAHTEDIASWGGAASLITLALDAFGGLDAVVNNAGITRDRMVVNMTEQEWDSVMNVHLRGTFAVTQHASRYWRSQSKNGQQRVASVVNTTSASGLFGNLGQANYAAAKAGIAAFTLVAASELSRYGVSVNAISPTALTRMTDGLDGVGAGLVKMDRTLAPEDVSPLVAWLCSQGVEGMTGRVFGVRGNRITVMNGWENGVAMVSDERWTVEQIARDLPAMVDSAASNAGMDGERTPRPCDAQVS